VKRGRTGNPVSPGFWDSPTSLVLADDPLPQGVPERRANCDSCRMRQASRRFEKHQRLPVSYYNLSFRCAGALVMQSISMTHPRRIGVYGLLRIDHITLSPRRSISRCMLSTAMPKRFNAPGAGTTADACKVAIGDCRQARRRGRGSDMASPARGRLAARGRRWRDRKSRPQRPRR
jgi:hypothetical protein